jgi:hypothetical protein
LMPRFGILTRHVGLPVTSVAIKAKGVVFALIRQFVKARSWRDPSMGPDLDATHRTPCHECRDRNEKLGFRFDPPNHAAWFAGSIHAPMTEQGFDAIAEMA